MTNSIETDPELPGDISRQIVKNLPVPMVIADPNQEDCPIIYVNRAFTQTTGYTADQAVGRNCRFLQGADTREEDREAIRLALSEAREVTVDIANYRADGEKFVNRLTIMPLRDDDGDLIYFLGVQIERSDEPTEAEQLAELDARLRELQHRVRNHLSMILGLIRIEAKRDPHEMIDLLAHRVRSLSLLYEEFVDHAGGTTGGHLDLADYVVRIATTLHEIDGRAGIELDLDVESMMISVDDAGRIGLVLSEIVTNAFRHGFSERDSGRLAIELVRDGTRARLTVRDDGRGIAPEEWPHPDSLGSKIVTELLERLGGRLEVAELPTGEGARVSLTFDVPAAGSIPLQASA